MRRSFRAEFFLFIFSFFITLFFSCTNQVKNEVSVGVDPSWSPVNIHGKEPSLSAFVTELLEKVSTNSGMHFVKVNASWDDLLEGLEKEKFQAALTSIEPYVYNVAKYSFSKNFFQTGPVIVVKKSATSSKLDKLYGKEIAVFSVKESDLLQKNYPDSLPRDYDSINEALTDVIMGSIDGALVDNIEANSYLSDIYQDKLKIKGKPLSNAGLKLITLKGQNQKVLEAFNRAIEDLQSSGELDKLKEKWKI